MERHSIRIHKVGAITFGIVLIILGVLFLLSLFFPKLDYLMIYHFWPLILIALGVEVLAGSRWKTFEVRDGEGRLLEQNAVVYDVPAIILTIILTVFAMGMGIMDWAFANATAICF